jgi:hypothetical protein
MAETMRLTAEQVVDYRLEAKGWTSCASRSLGCRVAGGGRRVGDGQRPMGSSMNEPPTHRSYYQPRW